jgi:hypothetical protein
LFEHALDENLWEQAVKTVQALPNDSSNELLIAALLRNVGKPFVGKTAQGGEDKHPTRSYVILLNELFPHWNSVGIEVNKDFEHVILSLVLHHDDIVHNYDSVCNSCRAIGDSHVSDFLNLKIAALSMIVDNNSFLVSQRELCVSLLERMNLRDSNPKVTQYQ